MNHTLRNQLIKLEVELPGEGYLAPRFDQTGKITFCSYKGIALTTTELPDGNDPALNGQGFYNEFDIDHPPGFAETKIGNWFHKIGVGLLKKETEDYHFAHRYQVRPAEFQVNSQAESILITCAGSSHNGYGYELQKKISLEDNGFCIDYQLKNTGEKQLETSEYVHNFIGIDQSAIGRDYMLVLPVSVSEDSLPEAVNPGEKVLLRGNQVHFEGRHDSPFFFSHLFGQRQVKASWKLINLQHNLAISEKGSFDSTKVNLWGWRHVICPELFINLNLEPDQSASWSRTYLIEESNSLS